MANATVLTTRHHPNIRDLRTGRSAGPFDRQAIAVRVRFVDAAELAHAAEHQRRHQLGGHGPERGHARRQVRVIIP